MNLFIKTYKKNTQIYYAQNFQNSVEISNEKQSTLL